MEELAAGRHRHAVGRAHPEVAARIAAEAPHHVAGDGLGIVERIVAQLTQAAVTVYDVQSIVGTCQNVAFGVAGQTLHDGQAELQLSGLQLAERTQSVIGAYPDGAIGR